MNLNQTYRVLAVDDDQTVLDQLSSVVPRYAKDVGSVSVDTCLSFDEAEARLKTFGSNYDLVILDVMDSHPFGGGTENGSRGTALYERIRSVRWLPVIFYTAIPENVDVEVESPMVVVVSKENTNLLRTSIVESLKSGAARTARTLVEDLDSGVRSFLANHVSPNWSAYSQQDDATLQRLLMNRLAAWLREWSTPTGELVAKAIGGTAPASAYYLLPPSRVLGLEPEAS
jgi:CheY-like chemotaxis protein